MLEVSGICPDTCAAISAFLHSCRTTWGVLINFEKMAKQKKQQVDPLDDLEDESDSWTSSSSRQGRRYIVDVLINCDAATVSSSSSSSLPLGMGGRQLPTFLPPHAKEGVAMVVTLPLEYVDRLSAVRLKALKDLRSKDARAVALRAVAEVVRRYQGREGTAAAAAAGGGEGPPLLDPEQDMQAKDKDIRKLVSRLESVEGKILEHELWSKTSAASAAAVAGGGGKAPVAVVAAAAGGGGGGAVADDGCVVRLLSKLQQKQGLAAAVSAAKKDIKAAQVGQGEGGGREGAAGDGRERVEGGESQTCKLRLASVIDQK